MLLRAVYKTFHLFCRFQPNEPFYFLIHRVRQKVEKLYSCNSQKQDNQAILYQNQLFLKDENALQLRDCFCKKDRYSSLFHCEHKVHPEHRLFVLFLSGVPAVKLPSGFSGFRFRSIPTLSLRNGFAALTIPNTFLSVTNKQNSF